MVGVGKLRPSPVDVRGISDCEASQLMTDRLELK